MSRPAQLAFAFILLATLAFSAIAEDGAGNMPAAEPGSFSLVDVRLPENLVSRREAEQYGQTVYFGDDALEPKPMSAVSAALKHSQSLKLSGKQIKLIEFTVKIFRPGSGLNQGQLDASAAGTPRANIGTQVLASLLIQGIQSFRTSKLVNVSIEVNIDGHPAYGAARDSFSGMLTSKNIDSVITLAIDDLVANIGNEI
ncbi:MAG: hypothetical protein V4634_00180 [Pseudomonadota bacterium]